MKNIIRRTAAALLAGTLMMSGSVGAFAEQTEDTAENIVLPSGLELDEVLGNISDEMSEEYSDDLEDASLGAASYAIFRGDEVIASGSYGYTDYKNHTPVDENSVFEWGSISKTMIWVSAMQLWEQGKLDLDRDVREYLPDGFFSNLSYDEPITMINLMNHDAGWCETTRNIWYEDDDEIPSLKEALQSIEPAQVTRPGERVAYSNYGAAVAGYVIECVSGTDYLEYVHKNIFEPLGMEHTALAPDHSDNEWVYEQRRKMHSYSFGYQNVDMGSTLEYVGAYPAGAATGTLSDLVTYAQALIDDEAPLFRSPDTQRELFTGTYFYGDSDIPVNAHGFFRSERGVRTYFHTGGTAFGQADMEFDLKSKVGVVVMHSDGRGSNWLMSRVPVYVFGELKPGAYGEPAGKRDLTDRYYLPARMPYRGMLSYIPLLNALQLSVPAEELGSGVLQLRGSSDELTKGGEVAMLLGTKTLPDGSELLENTSTDLIYDRNYLPKLLLFTAYFLTALTGFYMLRIRRKLARSHRDTGLAGSALVGIGQGARIASVAALTASFVIYYKYIGGVPLSGMTVIGVIQMLCGGLCCASAVSSCVTLAVKKDKTALAVTLNALNILANGLCIGAIAFYELYRFWGC
ncbi:MAG: beta-lactamase family protein [Ruminococcus sp.]|nr:beta-lactamase family protein [Ruminococcus sp.]